MPNAGCKRDTKLCSEENYCLNCHKKSKKSVKECLFQLCLRFSTDFRNLFAHSSQIQCEQFINGTTELCNFEFCTGVKEFSECLRYIFKSMILYVKSKTNGKLNSNDIKSLDKTLENLESIFKLGVTLDKYLADNIPRVKEIFDEDVREKLNDLQKMIEKSLQKITKDVEETKQIVEKTMKGVECIKNEVRKSGKLLSFYKA